MFSLGVSPQEIQDTLFQLKDVIYPNSIKLQELTSIIFGTSSDIQQRKVRLAIAELRKQGYLVIAKNGYSLAGDDPEVVIHFVNGLYSRAHKLTQEADIMYHEFKKKYGDEAAKKICQLLGQPMLEKLEPYLNPIFQSDDAANIEKHGQTYSEPIFRKTYDRDGTLHNV